MSKRRIFSEEEWRAIADHPYYEVSSMGRVRSIVRTLICADGRTRRFQSRLVQSHADDRMGYHRVVLYDHSAATGRTVHSLVAEAFLGPRPDDQEVRHLNSNPADNRVINLAYGTRSQNMLDAVVNGTHRNVIKTKCPRQHKLIEPNLVTSQLKRGLRECLACARARGYCQYHKDAEFVQTSHNYYERIMALK